MPLIFVLQYESIMRSTIADTLRDGTVLITGGTGFLGKVLTEKLLRSVPIKTIAILIRSKTGLTAEQQIADVYKQTVSICFKVL